MTRDDICQLARLARIELTEDELEAFMIEIPAVLDYVGAVQKLVAENADTEPKVGALYNIFRKDIVTNPGNLHTADLLAEMPQVSNRHMVVRKILNPDN
jgi:aspartyl-tRNA(Asn)/glutamyl-tRNA(Gln) amidotransferase subunit C